jgi:2-dehydro-3-deoxygluconokinase
MIVEAITLGQPIVALLPVDPVRIHEEGLCRWSVGGAELNVAVGLRRLGFTVEFSGRIGDDPLGQMVTDHLGRESLPVERLTVDPDRPTACYLREWLPDGLRRLVYYRASAAGSTMRPDDLRWPADPPRLLHVTGITPALGPSAARLVQDVVERARERGTTISFDPNYRTRLWSPDDARAVLGPLVANCDVLLMSDDDADLLFPGRSPEEALDEALAAGPRLAVIKRGAAGAIGHDGTHSVVVPASPVAQAVDPVGAGDGFDAGFLAGWLRGRSLHECLRLGAHTGARAVESAGEHESAPRLEELPADLKALLDPP